MAFIPSSGGGGGSIPRSGGFAGSYGQRACYVLFTHQSGAGYSFTFLNQDFSPLTAYHDMYSQHTYITKSTVQRYHSGNFMNHQMVFFDQYNGTQSQSGSSSSRFNNTFASNTQLGCPFGNFYSDGSFNGVYNHTNTYMHLWFSRKLIIPSDHSNRAINYLIHNGKLMARKVGDGRDDPAYSGTQDTTTISGLNASFTGMGCYNNTLKEFLLPHAEVTGSNGQINIQRYTNFDLDAYPSPTDAFANATLDSTFQWTPANWPSNDIESRYNAKWVLRNDGKLIHTVFFQGGGGVRTYVADRPTNGAATNGVHVNSISNTTSYGSDHGVQFGQHIVQSRDGKFVGIASPYYYYWTGFNAVFIHMESTLSSGSTNTYQDQSSSTSAQILPYRDTDLMVSRGVNGYASSGSGPQFARMFNVQKNSSGVVTIYQAAMSGTKPGMYTGANTTSYVPMFAVTDYGSLKYSTNSKATQPFNNTINIGA